MKGKRSEFANRYLDAYEAVLKRRELGIKRDADFCRAVNIIPQKLATVKSGKTDVSQAMLKDLHEIFGVRAEYLLLGTGDIFESSDPRQLAIRDRVIQLIDNDLIPQYGESARKFFEGEDYSHTSYSELKRGRVKEPPLPLKILLTQKYNVNWDYITTGEGEKFVTGYNQLPTEKNVIEKPIKEFLPKVITVSPDNEDKMILIPQKVAAGYLGNIADPEWVEDQPTISLPDMPRGKTTRAFEIEGDSMLPHFHEGAYVGCTFVENLDLIKEGYVYIVVTDDGVTMKRVFKRGNSLRLTSDNSLYKPFDIPLKEVREIWKVHRAITAQFPPPSETDAKVNHLELEVVKLGKTVALIAQKIGI